MSKEISAKYINLTWQFLSALKILSLASVVSVEVANFYFYSYFIKGNMYSLSHCFEHCSLSFVFSSYAMMCLAFFLHIYFCWSS